jgi:hypothetical protein
VYPILHTYLLNLFTPFENLYLVSFLTSFHVETGYIQAYSVQPDSI